MLSYPSRMFPRRSTHAYVPRYSPNTRRNQPHSAPISMPADNDRSAAHIGDRFHNYAYAEATATQSASDFIDATAHGFEYFGCVSEVAAPDKLRATVTRPDRHDPEIN